MRLKGEHLALVAGVVVLGVVLYVNRGCSSCAGKYNAMTSTGAGPWPGAGPGVESRPGT